MAVAGIDFSSRAVDVVLLDEDSDAATWHRFELVGADAFDRARSFRNVVLGDVFWNVMAIGIEDPRGYNSGALYRVQGAILARLPRTVLVHPLIPSVWRKTVGLPGNAPKSSVHAFAQLTRLVANGGGHPGDWPQDACDAFCIALATRSLIQVGEPA